MLLTIAVAAAIGVTASLMIWHERRSALEEHRDSMASMGIVLAEQTSRFTQLIDLVLQDTQSRIGVVGLATPMDFRLQLATQQVHRSLSERLLNLPQIDSLVVVDDSGRIVNWSRSSPLPVMDVSHRDYFQYFLTHDDRGLFVGSLSKSPGTGRLSLFFARRINAPDGRFFGLVLAVVDTKFISAFYQAAGEHLRQAVTLRRRDGTMLMRYPNPAAVVVAEGSPGLPSYAGPAEGGANDVGETLWDAAPALVSVQPVTDYPLVVHVTMTNHDIFAKWWVQTGYTALSALAAAIALASLLRGLRRQYAQLSEAAAVMQEGQQVLRSYTAMSSDWLWEQDVELRYRFAPGNPSIAGKTRWEAADPSMSEERWIPHKAELAARRPFRNFRWEWIDAAGRVRFAMVSGDPVFDKTGNFRGYRGTGRDITAEVEGAAQLAAANRELETGRQKFEVVLNNITQGICFFDSGKQLQLWNRRFTEIYGLAPDAVYVGCSLSEILQRRHEAGSTPDMTPAEYLIRQERVIAAEQPAAFVTPLGNGRFIAISHHPMPDGAWVATHEDITDRHQAEASIMFMARHDALTKLPNRMLFRERMEDAIAMSGRGVQFAVLCLDLNKFKQVNDTMGHPVGDALLIAVADRLQACMREVDTVARLGGDEFAIIQAAVRQPDAAEVLASRIIEAFLQPFDVDGHQIMSGVSIGVAVAPIDGIAYETLMRDADIALYLAKTERRSAVRFFEPEMDSRIHLRRLLELDLKAAMTENELELYYQPQVSLVSHNVSGFEALLRWHHPVRGLVSPLEFIPVAEETGMIVAIGEWVLRTACFEAENWPLSVSVAVNLSPIQFNKGDLVATVRAALKASGLRPDRLELEITESVFLRATPATVKTLQELRAMGISVALDDFGTGYSSLSYLRNFSVNKIKIDQSFVRDLTTSKESVSIVRAVIGLGKSLGMMTIAEGVETKEQLDELRTEGCTEVQGYFFGRPRPAGEVPAMLERLQTPA